MCLPLFRCKKISVPEFLRSARSSFLLFPIKKENRQRLYNLLSIFILKLILLQVQYRTNRSSFQVFYGNRVSLLQCYDLQIILNRDIEDLGMSI